MFLRSVECDRAGTRNEGSGWNRGHNGHTHLGKVEVQCARMSVDEAEEDVAWDLEEDCPTGERHAGDASPRAWCRGGRRGNERGRESRGGGEI
jgi:hypothetical protein